jgi:hypothetical protein
VTDTTDPLPELDAGVTLLRGADRSARAALVLAELDRRDAPAPGVDARNHAATHALTGAARSDRVLDRVQVARAFTAHQHYALVRQLVADARRPTGLVVAPAVDDLYRDDDLFDQEAERLRETALSTLAALAASSDAPVLVTASDPDAVSEYADAEIEVESTRFGPRFDGGDGETTTYWTRGAWQTTIPYWVDIAGRVEDRLAPPTPEVVA